jgi:hypothetical protein
MSAPALRSDSTQTRRLQLILLLLILWDAIAIAAELSYGGPLFKLSGSEIGGVIAARGSFGGAAAVTLIAYAYGLLRGAERHRGVLWLGVLEQGATALFAVYHIAVNDIEVEGGLVPLAVASGLLVLLLTNMPRQAAVP